MPSFLTLDSINLATPDGRPLFSGLTLAFGRERTGIVGRNGSGKSTLLRLIAGDIEPAAGSVQRSGSIGMLAQLLDDSLSVAEALGVADALARLARLESGSGSLDDAAEADWTLEARINAAFSETGLPGLARDRVLASLSGGERTRVALARLLLEAPDVLLLDEPTNNLDADGRDAVAQLLQTWQGGIIVASHDRMLLEHVERIVELTPVGVTVFGGGWSDFSEARDAARNRAAAELDKASDALRATERSVQQAKEKKARSDNEGRVDRARGGANKMAFDYKQDRAENSGSRASRLADRQIGARSEALEQAKARVEILTPLAIDLPKTQLHGGRALIAFSDVIMAHGARCLFGPLSFDIRGPERVAIAGANGSGKTTLLRLITGELQPTSGDIRHPTDRIAMLDQHVALLEPDASVLDNIRRLNPDLTDHAAHAVLARFAFRNTAALQIADTLSGGERLRAGFACVFARPEPPLLLLLDEPTNHLDLASIEVLEAALFGFDGALIVVSHDRSFLEAIGITREIVLRPSRPGAFRPPVRWSPAAFSRVLMTAPHTEWTVLPHGDLTAVENAILTVTGTVKMPIGTFERRMTVVRLTDGRLVIYSPIALAETQMIKLEDFGAPAFLIVPGSHHRVDARIWKDRYPSAQVIASEGARAAVEDVVHVDSTAPDFADPSVRFYTVAGTSEDESALTVSSAGGTTLILNDILANVQNAEGLSGVIAKVFGFAGKKPQIPLPEKLSILDDKQALAAQLCRWSDIPTLKRIIVSHGEIIEDDPVSVLRDVAKTLD